MVLSQRAIKRAAYRASKALGLFTVSRRLTAKGLRVLCYHGISVDDEYRWRPMLFMRPDVFRRRLATLARGRYPVLSLEEAVTRLEKGTLPPCATVITFDDGFAGNFMHSVEPLRQHEFPATVYVTTYYAAKGTPIFRLLVQYMLWKSTVETIDAEGFFDGASGPIDLRDAGALSEFTRRIIEHGERNLDETGRVALSRKLAGRLEMDYEAIAAQRSMSLMSLSEITAMSEAGIDIQLHTHRHVLPEDPDLLARELSDNRAVLEGLLQRRLTHLCYPSGQYTRRQWPDLEAAGIASATTCERGLNYRDTPRLGLRRFLDSDEFSTIEFEAELSGFTEMLRTARGAAVACARKLRMPGPVKRLLPSSR